MASQFKIVNYPAVGASYQSPSLPASAQRTVNMYPEALPNGLTQVVLHQFPGLNKKLSGITSEFDRGTHVFQDSLYQVAGASLYKITDGYSRVLIGSVAGANRVSMSDNGVTMVIVTDGNGEYTYDGTTFTATSIGSNPSNVSYLNSRFFYDDDDGRVGVSGVGTVPELSGYYFSPESAPDSLVRTYVFNQTVYLFGEKTVEPWQNVTSGTPPMERMNGAIIENVGLAGRNAIASTEKAMYFVSSTGGAVQLQAFAPQQISTMAIANVWRDYTWSDAIVNTVNMQSLDFVIFSFPTDGKTWAYVEQYGLWFELEHGTSKGRWRGASIVFAYGLNLVADYATGNLYELDPDTYTDDNTVCARERVFQPLAGETFGTPRQKYQLTEFGLSCETGVGSALELEPLIAVSFSTNGAKTFSNEVFKQIGQEGEYISDVKVSSNKHFRDLVVKIRYTEPTKFSIYSSYVKIREAGTK